MSTVSAIIDLWFLIVFGAQSSLADAKTNSDWYFSLYSTFDALYASPPSATVILLKSCSLNLILYCICRHRH